MNQLLPSLTSARRHCLAVLGLAGSAVAGPLQPQVPQGRPLESAYSTTTSAPTSSLDPQKAFLGLDELEALPPAPQAPAAESRPLSDRAAQYLRRGEELMDEERYTEAGRELEKALRSDPSRHEIHRALAMAMHRAGNKERAGAHAKQAIQYHPDDLLPHYVLGRLAFNEPNHPGAIHALRRAIASSNLDSAPDFAALAYAYLARSLEAEGYLTAALRAYQEYERRASAVPPALATANQELSSLLHADGGSAADPVSRILERLGRPAEAADALGRWLANHAADSATRARYARLLAAANRFDEALAQCRVIGEAAEDFTTYIELLSDIRRLMGEPRLALEDLQALLQGRPNDPSLTRAYVDLLRRFGETQEAERILGQFLTAHPAASEMAWGLYDEHINTGRGTDAFALAIRTVAADPEAYPQALVRLETLAKDPRAVEEILGRDWGEAPLTRSLLGLLALRAGKTEQGVGLLRAALDANPNLPSARFAIGEQLLKGFRWQDAIDLSREAAEKDGNLEWILGEAHAGLDDDDAAADHYSAAIRLNRADTRSMLSLARLYERTDRPLRAQRQYEAILQIDALNEESHEALINLLVAGRQIQEAQAHLTELRKMAASPNRIARAVARLELEGGAGSLDRFRQTLDEAMTQGGPDTDSLLLIAASFLSTGDVGSAEPHLRKVLEIDPGNVQARELLIPVHARQLRFEEAAHEQRELLRRHPNRAAWILKLADVLRKDQKYDEAAALLTAFLDRGKLTGKPLQEIREELLGVLGAGERHGDRIVMIRKWLTEDESDSAIRVALIQAHLDAKDFEAAQEWTRKWCEAAPGDAELAALWREVLRSAGRFVAAEQLSLDALEEDPTNENLQFGMIRVLRDAKRFDDALELVESHVSGPAESGRDVRFLISKLDILDEAKRYEDAALLLTRMIQDESIAGEGAPLDADLLQLQLARILVNGERLNEAQTKLGRWIERTQDPQARFEYLRLLSLIHQQRGLSERALESLEMAYAIRPESPTINNDLGYTLADMGRRIADAERMVRLAVGHEPENSAYLDSLGWVLYRMGDFDEARQWLQKAARARDDREDPVIFDHLGDASWRVSERDEAVQHWKKSLALAEERLKEREEATYRRVLDSVKTKLEAVEAGQPPQIAEVVKDEPEPKPGQEADEPAKSGPTAPTSEPAAPASDREAFPQPQSQRSLDFELSTCRAHDSSTADPSILRSLGPLPRS